MFHINFVNEGNIYETEPIEILITSIYEIEDLEKDKSR